MRPALSDTVCFFGLSRDSAGNAIPVVLQRQQSPPKPIEHQCRFNEGNRRVFDQTSLMLSWQYAKGCLCQNSPSFCLTGWHTLACFDTEECCMGNRVGFFRGSGAGGPWLALLRPRRRRRIEAISCRRTCRWRWRRPRGAGRLAAVDRPGTAQICETGPRSTTCVGKGWLMAGVCKCRR